jgi:hypothetical protein
MPLFRRTTYIFFKKYLLYTTEVHLLFLLKKKTLAILELLYQSDGQWYLCHHIQLHIPSLVTLIVSFHLNNLELGYFVHSTEKNPETNV